MTARMKCLLAVFVVSLLSGCAGREFTRPDMATLRNGETTRAQVIEKFGKPFAEGSLVRNDEPVRSANYVYAATGGRPAREGIVPARAMSLYFSNDVLVGHEFISSWADDSTDFDETERKQIVAGKTTQAELLQLLGKPSGYWIYPMIKSKSGQAAVYALDVASLGLSGRFGGGDALKSMQGHILASGQWVGTFTLNRALRTT